jgi:restriction endonuclease S subunit
LTLGKRVLKKNIRNSTAGIPIYSANVFKPIGYWTKSGNLDFSKDHVIWGIDGYFEFNVKKKDELFCPTDHCGVIEIKDINILPEYLVNALYSVRSEYGFDRSLRASLKNIAKVRIKIPVMENGSFDIEKQKKISNIYNLINEIRGKLREYAFKIENARVDPLRSRPMTKDYPITSLFDIYLGSAKYNKKYFQTHKGRFPVYSGKTKENGMIASIDDFQWDTEGLTWTIDGYAGRVFHRNGKFSLTTHCGLLTLKDPYKDKLDYDFLRYLLDSELPLYSVGEGNKRLKKTHISKISIPIPITDKGEINKAMQIEISKIYSSIEEIKNSMKVKLEGVLNTDVKIEKAILVLS